MGQALYRKYRPKRLSEVVGQEHITATLETALKSGRISHAYLFSGPKGVGKTSIARILAHEINGLEYTDESVHLDIIEIDAASNRRIDEIRDLREKVYIAPTSGKYKVYIIDEVHMLTREAFNALLKTLEEPPAHAVFILATTESHKLPDTIISRTQHYTFKPVDRDKVIEHLSDIAKREKITITKDALELLAAHGQGSFRDSISLLDQAGSIGTKVDAPEVRRLLGIAPKEAIDELVGMVRQPGQAGAILQKLGELYGQGLQGASIASQLAARIRESLAATRPVLPVDMSLKLMRALIEIPASHNPERLLEITLLEAGDNSAIPVATVALASAPASSGPERTPPETPRQPKKTQKSSHTSDDTASSTGNGQSEAEVHNSSAELSKAATVEAAVAVQPASANRDLDDAAWPEVLGSIKKQYNTLYGVLRMAKPIFSGDEVELQFKFAFHQKRLNEVKNRKIIADFFKQVTGRNVSIRCTVNKDAVPAAVSAPPAQAGNNGSPEVLGSIADIFGGGEVLNS